MKVLFFFLFCCHVVVSSRRTRRFEKYTLRRRLPNASWLDYRQNSVYASAAETTIALWLAETPRYALPALAALENWYKELLRHGFETVLLGTSYNMSDSRFWIGFHFRQWGVLLFGSRVSKPFKDACDDFIGQFPYDMSLNSSIRSDYGKFRNVYKESKLCTAGNGARSDKGRVMVTKDEFASEHPERFADIESSEDILAAEVSLGNTHCRTCYSQSSKPAEPSRVSPPIKRQDSFQNNHAGIMSVVSLFRAVDSCDSWDGQILQSVPFIKWLPCAVNYFPERIIHGKTLFNRGDGLPRLLELFNAPFIAGMSGSMFQVILLMESTFDQHVPGYYRGPAMMTGVVEDKDCARERVILGIINLYILGGHHSFLELFLTAQLFGYFKDVDFVGRVIRGIELWLAGGDVNTWFMRNRKLYQDVLDYWLVCADKYLKGCPEKRERKKAPRKGGRL